MNNDSIELLKRAFRRYYFYKYDGNVPSKIERREFGYSTFNNNMIRHLSFNNKDELRAFLVREIPADVYSSNAYYTNPTAEMDLKGWLAADLIFDIDIKDLKPACMMNHQVSICPNCKRISNADMCNNCNIAIKHVNIPCNNCIDAGKREVLKLMDIVKDLGCNKIDVYFSGNNGFHIHIEDEELSYLDSQARIEIVNYVSGEGIIPEIFGINNKRNKAEIIKRIINAKKGWKGRIIKQMLAEKDEYSLLRSLLRKKYDTFNKELQDIAKKLGVKIDGVVTTDVHRIFRLQYTLSSKSGLAKIKVDSIDEFNPFKDACLLDDENIKVHVYYTPQFMLNENNFGPYKDVDVYIPLYAAVYLICKGLADIIT